jgi:hypothetical protein
MSRKTERTPGPSNGARFIFLDSAEPKSKAHRILGAVTTKSCAKRPFENYRPNWRDPELARMLPYKARSADQTENPDRKELEDVMNDIWLDAEPVELEDVLARKKLAVSTDVNVKFTELLKGFIRRDRTEEVDILSGEVKLHKFDNPGQNIHDMLLECEPWKRQVAKLINNDIEGKGYYIVVGVAAFANVQISWTHDRESGQGVAAKVPGEVLNAATHGVPVIQGKAARKADIGGDWQRTKTEGSRVFAKCTQEVIFAVAYSELLLELADEEIPDEVASSTTSLTKQPGMLARLGHKLGFGKKSQSMPASNPSQKPKPKPKAKKRIESASVGMPIYGYGLNSAFGSEDGVSQTEDDSGGEQGYAGSDHLTVPSKEGDVFYIGKEDYIEAGEEDYVNGEANGSAR